jgi:hypothetical protein
MKMSDGVCDVKLYSGGSPVGGALSSSPVQGLSPTAIATVVNNHVNSPTSSSCASSSNGNGIANNHINTQNLADYLAQLIKDKKQLAIFPNLFLHLDRILDEGKYMTLTKKSLNSNPIQCNNWFGFGMS